MRANVVVEMHAALRSSGPVPWIGTSLHKEGKDGGKAGLFSSFQPHILCSSSDPNAQSACNTGSLFSECLPNEVVENGGSLGCCQYWGRNSVLPGSIFMSHCSGNSCLGEETKIIEETEPKCL